MDDFDLEIKKEFINEAIINLEEVEGAFMELESSSNPQPLLEKIFRLAHNLKGGSRAVGFGEVAEFTHQFENLVQSIQKGKVALTPEVVTTLLQCNDRLIEILNGLKNDIGATFDNADVLADIKSWIEGTRVAPAPSSVEPPVPAPAAEVAAAVAEPLAPQTAEADIVAQSPEPLVDEVTPIEEPPAPSVPAADAFFAVAEEKPVAKVEAPAPQAKKPEVARAADKGKEDEIVRVNLSKIDSLNDYVGELIVLQSVIQQQANSGASSILNSSMRQMIKLSKDIQGLSMSLRMLPVKPLVQKLQRVVRDTAKSLEKEVQLRVEGDNIDIDKTVLDRLVDPLIHILRNAVDHGLETTQDRIQSGKSKEGYVSLSFSNEGNYLVVQVKDDGKGIDPEIIKRKAIEKGLIDEKQTYSERQLINLVFHPGFSTKQATTEISGRGVGMDVVKTNIEKMGGQVDITTSVGQGSNFRIQIPLSLAVIDGMVVLGEKSRYVIPISQIHETINLKSQRVFQDQLGIGSCFELRGEVVPLYILEDVLKGKLKPITNDQEGTALIVAARDQLVGLVVRDIVRTQQIVIKPLENGVKAQKGWIGACVLGDGLPTLILSPVDMVEGKIVQSSGEFVQERSA